MAAKDSPLDTINRSSSSPDCNAGSDPPTQVPLYGGPLSILMPVENKILSKARQLASHRNVRVDALATCIVQDPVLALEILRIANAMFFVQDRPPITTCEMALVRLGSQNVLALLNELQLRPGINDETIKNGFEELRTSATAASLIAKLLAKATNKDLADEAQTVGLVSYTGLMLACIHLGSKFVNLFGQLSRASLIYRLAHAHNFDPRLMQLNYLRRYGFPEGLLFALDRELVCKTPERSPLRFIIESAVELVEAFRNDKWSKYAKDDELPVQSALRLIQIPSNQYASIYSRAGELLEKTTNPQPEIVIIPQEAQAPVKEELIIITAEQVDAKLQPEPQPLPKPLLQTSARQMVTIGQVPDEGEILAILKGEAIDNSKELDLFRDIRNSSAVIALDNNPPTAAPSNSNFKSHTRSIPSASPQIKNRHLFTSINISKAPTFVVAEEADLSKSNQLSNPELITLVKEVSDLCASAKTVQDILQEVLALLIKDGPFSRAALIVLSPERLSAHIHSAVGEGLSIGEAIPVNDPVSPLATCLTRIQSFNSQQYVDELAPLGVSSYAVSPVNVQHATPVVLYADSGSNDPLPFESRRAFRSIVGLLNRFLPTLPGVLS